MGWRKEQTAEFRCECHTHYMVVERFDERLVWLGFYARYRDAGWRKRLKDAWALLRDREVLVDDFVFDRDTAIRAGKAMEEAGAGNP